MNKQIKVIILYFWIKDKKFTALQKKLSILFYFLSIDDSSFLVYILCVKKKMLTNKKNEDKTRGSKWRKKVIKKYCILEKI